jgi:hypothetical protein
MRLVPVYTTHHLHDSPPVHVRGCHIKQLDLCGPVLPLTLSGGAWVIADVGIICTNSTQQTESCQLEDRSPM